jgi:hypothetical protein
MYKAARLSTEAARKGDRRCRARISKEGLWKKSKTLLRDVGQRISVSSAAIGEELGV